MKSNNISTNLISGLLSFLEKKKYAYEITMLSLFPPFQLLSEQVDLAVAL